MVGTPDARGGDGDAPRLRALLLEALAARHAAEGEAEAARETATEAAALFEELGDASRASAVLARVAPPDALDYSRFDDIDSGDDD